ncbi:MAG TPA: fatty acyl-AMP ligase [Candidatus Dormibacteraeota bacterium]|nr:fatty acyl-AMP ligase [Candidatus Dormibacteraeota bacterium]
MPAETLVSLLRERAEGNRADAAFGFLVTDGAEPVRMTYADLDVEARRVAVELAYSLAPGSRVVLVYLPGPAFVVAFFGALYAGLVPVPVSAPNVARLAQWQEHVGRIIADVSAGAVLTTRELLELREAAGVEIGDPSLAWIATDEAAAPADVWTDPRVRPDDFALIQYTSGSTSRPKGVLLGHGSLLANQRAIDASFQLGPESVVVSWLPMYHDMGLIGCLMYPMFVGCDAWFLSPLDFLQRPVRWLEAISRLRGTCSGGPNFAYDLCVRRATDEDRARLDLSSWDVAFNGSEPVRVRTLRRFSETFAGCGFRAAAFLPCYGMAECSLFVTGRPALAGAGTLTVDRVALSQGVARPAPAGAVGAVELASSGGPSHADRVVVADLGTGLPLPDGHVGEILVRSASAGDGYWNQPDETRRVFDVCLATEPEPFLRTGDLGFLHDGELFVTGRSKEVIIRRGRNIHPQDVEDAGQLADSRLRAGCGAAFTLPQPDGDDGMEPVVLVQETGVTDPGELRHLIEAVRRRVVESQDVVLDAVVLVEPRCVPKTSSGKLQRGECRRAYLAGDLPVVAQWRREDDA